MSKDEAWTRAVDLLKLVGIPNAADRAKNEALFSSIGDGIIATNEVTRDYRNEITAHARPGGGGFWEINTASHIDWPQQGRTVEILRTDDGHLVFGTVVIDHAGPVLSDNHAVSDLVADGRLESPVALAGLSRYLAANDWQRFDGSARLEVLEGQVADRNAWLWIKDPLAAK